MQTLSTRSYYCLFQVMISVRILLCIIIYAHFTEGHLIDFNTVKVLKISGHYLTVGNIRHFCQFKLMDKEVIVIQLLLCKTTNKHFYRCCCIT